VSPNPGGKPTASRALIQGRFIKELADSFERVGKQAIAECAAKRPDKYLMVIAALMPKQLEITRPLDGLTDDELSGIAERLRSSLSAQSDRERITFEGELQPVEDVSALPEADGVSPGGE
jgi:hypothetical protein